MAHLINTTTTRKDFKYPVSDDDKVECKKFMAKYCAKHNMSAEDCANRRWHPRDIHADLYSHYQKFYGYPIDKMQTSIPLIQSMYTYMNRVKKNVVEFTERIQDWMDIKENSHDQFTDGVKDMTLSEKSDVVSAHDVVSDQAQKSSSIAHNEVLEPGVD